MTKRESALKHEIKDKKKEIEALTKRAETMSAEMSKSSDLLLKANGEMTNLRQAVVTLQQDNMVRQRIINRLQGEMANLRMLLATMEVLNEQKVREDAQPRRTEKAWVAEEGGAA